MLRKDVTVRHLQLLVRYFNCRRSEAWTDSGRMAWPMSVVVAASMIPPRTPLQRRLAGGA